MSLLCSLQAGDTGLVYLYEYLCVCVCLVRACVCMWVFVLPVPLVYLCTWYVLFWPCVYLAWCIFASFVFACVFVGVPLKHPCVLCICCVLVYYGRFLGELEAWVVRQPLTRASIHGQAGERSTSFLVGS